ncbi:hypothetical protein BAUCODRAFT_199934 [Baudoinia panamericana UAMH 10762]|uniref:Uncharacterized protein n=1 Tax=Baudoinia panamericana (strain UAMH 10762) TaxID=717646 RepID=M2NNR3_BAUPA|nr:uncharacterized protein BAUCODRAFT_199934 [Baudoinia panamericana UAMH 10762]EMD01165.1 hypothetical protein BAUCODRAFT_199934 [Baudoinia panamericana UAMH 10762]
MGPGGALVIRAPSSCLPCSTRDLRNDYTYTLTTEAFFFHFTPDNADIPRHHDRTTTPEYGILPLHETPLPKAVVEWVRRRIGTSARRDCLLHQLTGHDRHINQQRCVRRRQHPSATFKPLLDRI